MTDTELKELNERIARFSGFKYYPGSIGHADTRRPDGRWCKLPDFTTSLDALFKWPVPKLGKKIDVRFSYHASGKVVCSIGLTKRIYKTECIVGEWKDVYQPFASIQEGESPAIALALAIDKLISEVK